MIFLLSDIQVFPLKMCWKVWIKASRWHPSKTVPPFLFHSDLCGHWRDMFSCRQMSSGLAFTKANTHAQVLMEGYHITFMFCYQYISSFQLLNCVQLVATPWTAACQASRSITNSWSLPKLMSIESVMPCNHLILCRSLLLMPSIFPSSGSFQMSQLFTSGDQSMEVSASTSVLPMNNQDWSPLEWTGWISLQSKGLSRVFSNTTVQKYQFFCAQLSSKSNFHIRTWPLEKP